MRIDRDDHRQAINALLRNPEDSAAAEKLLSLAIDDPGGSAEVHQAVAGTPELIPLDLVYEPYDRHNLHMPRKPKRIVKPDSLDSLIDELQRAAVGWHQAKAIGDGYGFSNTGFTQGWLFVMVEKLNQILEVDVKLLRDPASANKLCSFQAGTTIDTVNRYLWKERKQALWNQPGYEKLTYVGTMSSGGHGSGTSLGPLSSQVRSLRLVTVDQDRKVIQLQVEPADGITDPDRFFAASQGVELVQNDVLFHACTVGLGCLGVIYSATIEVRGAYNILESRTMKLWHEVRDDLPELIARQGRDLHSVEIWVNPYPVDGKVRCVLGTRQETDDPPRGHRGIGVNSPFTETATWLISWWMRNHPRAIPGLLNFALKLTTASDVVMPATEGLNFGSVNNAPVNASACGVSAEKTGEAMDGLIEMLAERAKSEDGYVTSPVGLRFVKASRAHLSPQFGRDTCMLEMPILAGTPKSRETLRAFHDLLFDPLFKGRPHWGQINDMPGSRLEELYPGLGEFLDSYRVLNPTGFFDNDFTKQMGLRERVTED